MKLEIRPFKQSKGLCGAASMKMIMDYYGINRSEIRWAKLTAVKISKKSGKIDRNFGCSEHKMIQVAKSLGFKGCVRQHATIGELKKFIARGIPLIVNWFSPEEGAHFSVVTGFEKDNIILADPHFGESRKHKIEWFEDRWFDCVPYPLKRVKDLILRSIIVWYK